MSPAGWVLALRERSRWSWRVGHRGAGALGVKLEDAAVGGAPAARLSSRPPIQPRSEAVVVARCTARRVRALQQGIARQMCSVFQTSFAYRRTHRVSTHQIRHRHRSQPT